MTSMLEVDGLVVRRGRETVLDGIDLSVAQGEVVALLGPNGAGKSTLLDTLAGVLRAERGEVTCQGRVATVRQSAGLARRSVRANVELALAWWGVPRRQRRARAMRALQAMRAEHLASRPALSLSGGERRRVHLARAVAVEADLLLLDEPFVGLDPEAHRALCEDASSALRTGAGAVLLVVHDRSEAWAMADRLVVLTEGRVVAQGSPRAVLAAPPTPEVARFLGYDGELREDGAVLLTRAVHVRLDPTGDVAARITQVVPREDGARLTLDTGRGILRAQSDEPVSLAAVGEQRRVRLTGGVHFPAG